MFRSAVRLRGPPVGRRSGWALSGTCDPCGDAMKGERGARSIQGEFQVLSLTLFQKRGDKKRQSKCCQIGDQVGL
ncbi:hypothetical protein DAI22_09g132800 [Oryza sativa Japonica Group]|nr:hypothetical protein DAI22_09g132800 [Oryza sativa Japonica Group]